MDKSGLGGQGVGWTEQALCAFHGSVRHPTGEIYGLDEKGRGIAVERLPVR